MPRKKKKATNLKFLSPLIRYSIVVLLALFNLAIFSSIFTPLTVYTVYWILKLFFSTALSATTIIINGRIPIELIEACIASAAYYLLFAFNMSVPNVNIKKRLLMILSSSLSLLILNILRILILTIIYVSGASSFVFIHKLFWYALSTIFVLGIWFAEVKIFKIKDIPFYSDLKFLSQKLRKSKR